MSNDEDQHSGGHQQEAGPRVAGCGLQPADKVAASKAAQRAAGVDQRHRLAQGMAATRSAMSAKYGP